MAISKSIFNLSYDQNNPKVNKLIKDAFSAISKNDIRVGYIDPAQGYVINVSVCEANEYAKKNPATRFIFRDGDNNIRYLNINEVNDLEADDLIPQNECGGIQAERKCDTPPTIQILGGGGVGALANPIIGSDGSLLAIDIVEGGYGYQYPPQIRILDPCRIGTGAVARSFLGEIVDTVETYEDEFENYEICEPTDPGYENIYGPNGENLGKWDPSIYFGIDQNNIALVIDQYQEQLRKFKNPFWTTRSTNPLKIASSDNKIYSKVYPVTYSVWDEFMNSHAISPISPSNIPRSDNAGKLFTMEWSVDFPYDGEYIFRGLCDNVSKIYFDNLFLGDLKEFGGSVIPIKRYIKKGTHNIRVDLTNKPIIETIRIEENESVLSYAEPEIAILEERVPVKGWNGPGLYLDLRDLTGSVQVNFRMVEQESGIFHGINFRDIDTITESIGSGTRTYTLEGGRIYGPCTPTVSRGTRNEEVRVFAGNETPKDVRNSGGRPANQIVVEEGRDDWNDFVIGVDKGVFKRFDSSPTITVKKPQEINQKSIKTLTVFNTVDYIAKANRTLWRTNVYGRGGFLNDYGVCPFDTTQSLINNPYAGTHRIVWNNVKFPVTGRYKIRVAVDDNVTISIGDQITIRKDGFVPGTSASTGELNQEYFIKEGTYTITADLEQKPGGRFGFTDVKGINPMALAVDIKTTYEEKTKITYRTEEVVAPKSWNENPMGVSLTIDAPEPPALTINVPPVQEGRCPPNPIWSTRSPGAKEKWYPVRYTNGNIWSLFMNSYAISPVKPLDTLGSDRAGTTYKNSWDIEIPYNGFYGVKGARDDLGRLLIDGKEISKLDGFDVKNPEVKKVFLEKGKHVIEVEVYNNPQETKSTVDKKVFSTKDWQNVSASEDIVKIQGWNGPGLYLDLTSYDGNIPVNFRMIEQESGIFHGINFRDIDTITESIGSGSRTYTLTGGRIYGPCTPTVSRGTRNEEVRVFAGNEAPGDVRNSGGRPANQIVVEEGRDDWNDFVIGVDKGVFKRFNSQPTIKINQQSTTRTLGQITYSGPPLFNFKISEYGSFLNDNGVSPNIINNINQPSPSTVGTFSLKWTNVDFPEDGEYSLDLSADNLAIVKVGGVEVARYDNFREKTTKFFNTSKGKKTVEVILTNFNDGEIFARNPAAIALYINKKITTVSTNQKSWYDNPTGISAILIPPPCPRKISGRGVVSRIIVTEPGNGYFTPDITPPTPLLPGIGTAVIGVPDIPGVPGGAGIGTTLPGGPGIGTGFPGPGDISPGYPVTLSIDEIIITDPGIGYDPNNDRVVVIPDNGAQISFDTDPFGRVTTINVDAPGVGFTEYPTIYIETDTGINFSAVPVFNVIRDPIALPGITADKLIQVTDLVGLKQTGYVNGRPYYGAVYYENGVRFAGYYKTVGDPIRVYDTLQESITGIITTTPSAIEKFGTDTNSNNPNLNIPGTPRTTT